MGSGYRDSFAANIDNEFGAIYDSVADMDFVPFARRRARRVRKKKGSKKVNVRRRRRMHMPRRRMSTARPRRAGRRRKGMSKEFLRQLRKKHHLGEFKRR